MEVTCPIRSVDLPEVPDIELRDLIVVVGPNSSGKTQFLHDLNEIVCGRHRKLVVATAVSLRPPLPFNEYFTLLLERGFIQESSSDRFLKLSLQYGTDEGAGSFYKSTVQTQYQQLIQAAQNKISGSVPEYVFLKELGALSCSALFLKNRLTLTDSCSNFNNTSEGPTKTLQALYRKKKAKQALFNEISQVFHRAVWVDNTRHTQLVLRVSDSKDLPPADDRLEPEVMEQYRTIETEGDGLRSYCAICATLLLEQRPLCIVDEPELCLHPPQAHAMGRFLGTHASEKSCTIVATHSSHVLRGILETRPKAHVIRLSRVGSIFQARNLIPELLEQATSKPRSRSEAILEGLLSPAVVLCEAEGDRIVYESTYRTLKDRHLDIRFIASEGTGGFVDPLRLYKALNVPSAVITDIDFLAKDIELKNVLTELGTPPDDIPDLCKRSREAIKRIRSCVLHLNPQDIQNELKMLCETPINLTNNEDGQLRSKLQSLVDRLYRLRMLKEKGTESIPEEVNEGTVKIALRQDVKSLITELSAHGLFIVSVGELESWLPIIMKGQSREDKSKWAILAAEKIEDASEREEDVWLFMQSVYDFLQKQLGKLVAKS